MLAEQGAKVVVNDLGGDRSGESGEDDGPALQVVQEIEAMGGEAVANGGNVADFEAAGEMVQQAIDTFGRLDVVINNAGILRDRMLVNMSEAEWDAVIAVHLKGTSSGNGTGTWPGRPRSSPPVRGISRFATSGTWRPR